MVNSMAGCGMKRILMFKNKYPRIFNAIILTPVLAFISLLLTGHAGEGMIVLKLIYPYTFFLIGLLQIEDNSTWAIVVYAGFLLYVIYGVLLTIADNKGKIKEAKRVILIAHIAAAMFCILLFP